MKTIIRTEDAPSSPYYSQAVMAGGFLFVSGMTAMDPRTGKLAGGTIQEQTARALQSCERILSVAGASLQNIVDVQILLARPEDFAGFNEAYASFFPVDPPARSVARLGVELPGVLVSIRMVAVLSR
ncbi:MAG TPA: Rid family hydrolase [Steroidobacteraceae bacterium]|nr:Rid family hydrolase [Steroidobacteraceae bacterium]